MTRLSAIRKIANADSSWLYSEALVAIGRVMTLDDNAPAIDQIVRAYTVCPDAITRLESRESRDNVIRTIRASFECSGKVRITVKAQNPYTTASILKKISESGCVSFSQEDLIKMDSVMNSFKWEDSADRIFILTLRPDLNELWFVNWMEPLIEDIEVGVE